MTLGWGRQIDDFMEKEVAVETTTEDRKRRLLDQLENPSLTNGELELIRKKLQLLEEQD